MNQTQTIWYNPCMIKDKVKKTIIDNDLIAQGEHIVIGLSGGPDSVCLFHVLYNLKEELGIELHAVHINHGLRQGAADEDQQYVEALCTEYNVPCNTFSFDVNRIAKEAGISGEEAGRQVRYQSFYEVAERITACEGHPVKIAVAQNMNDQAETILMRIIRGTGIDGIGGIEYSRKEKESAVIIRPLLDVSREEIEEYCNMHSLEPRIDLTNLEPIYTRNKIRLELIPYLRDNFNTNIVASINRLSKIAREDKDCLYKKVDEVMRQHVTVNKHDRICIPLRILNEEHPAIRHRVIMKIFERIGLTKDITAAHLQQADKLIAEGRTSSVSNFTGEYVIEISYGMAEFFKKIQNKKLDFEYEIKCDNITESTKIIELFELNAEIRVKKSSRKGLPGFIENISTGSKNNVCFLNLDKIVSGKSNPVIRTRRRGDYIRPLGMKGRKKIQDFFVDEKFAKEERDRIPLLCLGSEVIWVLGFRISENYKIEKDTEQIIVLEYLPKI